MSQQQLKRLEKLTKELASLTAEMKSKKSTEKEDASRSLHQEDCDEHGAEKMASSEISDDKKDLASVDVDVSVPRHGKLKKDQTPIIRWTCDQFKARGMALGLMSDGFVHGCRFPKLQLPFEDKSLQENAKACGIEVMMNDDPKKTHIILRFVHK